MATAATIAAKINRGYGKAAKVLGAPYIVARPFGTSDLSYLAGMSIGVILASFTNAKASGFNFTKGQGFDDISWSVLADMAGILPGDFLVEAQPPIGSPTDIYFVLDGQPFSPPSAILCNRTVSHLRENSQLDADGGQGEGQPSQTGGSGRYFGYDQTPDTDDIGPGERTLAANVPVALVPLAGAARGQGEVPTDAPGPGRWRMYLPVSVFPLGTVNNGDIFVDEQGSRYQVATNGWSALGYKVEMIRLEN